MDNQKLEDIEVAVAHQEQQSQDLNEVVIDLGKQIELLNLRLDKALGKIELLEGGEHSEATPIDRPPHW